MSRRDEIKVDVGRFADALDELAVDMRTDPADALARVLDVALDNDALFARSLLKVKRRVRVAEVA